MGASPRNRTPLLRAWRRRSRHCLEAVLQEARLERVARALGPRVQPAGGVGAEPVEAPVARGPSSPPGLEGPTQPRALERRGAPVVDAPGAKGRGGFEVGVGQQALLGQQVEGQVQARGEGAGRAVGRVAGAGRADRQHLPPGEAGGGAPSTKSWAEAPGHRGRGRQQTGQGSSTPLHSLGGSLPSTQTDRRSRARWPVDRRGGRTCLPAPLGQLHAGRASPAFRATSTRSVASSRRKANRSWASSHTSVSNVPRRRAEWPGAAADAAVVGEVLVVHAVLRPPSYGPRSFQAWACGWRGRPDPCRPRRRSTPSARPRRSSAGAP